MHLMLQIIGQHNKLLDNNGGPSIFIKSISLELNAQFNLYQKYFFGGPSIFIKSISLELNAQFKNDH